ncbi:hypothetical protein [Flavobacterium sp. NRK1]|uniref:hypothetical protein n=1 Tax=Flavobacterium sp. NRK1 TaxID=2954929 RepID=UPI00209249E4|nr:hypothetical protein [Flavobacterium sp. NRK1]MCO6149430.1 hypothetical protein [Flavobacterium sp. NRK1]
MTTSNPLPVYRYLIDKKKIKSFHDEMLAIENENPDFFSTRTLNSFFFLTQSENITINFIDSSLPIYIKNKVISAFMKNFTCCK